MSKSWAEKNRSQNVQDYAKKEDLRLAQHQRHRPVHDQGLGAGQEIVFTQHKGWWGKLDGNVTDVVYNPVKSDATRVSALLAGDVDLVTDLPVQDVERLRKEPKLKILDGHEVRTIFIGMDQHARSSSTRTSRARTRSRTCACARRSTWRSTARRSSAW